MRGRPWPDLRRPLGASPVGGKAPKATQGGLHGFSHSAGVKVFIESACTSSVARRSPSAA